MYRVLKVYKIFPCTSDEKGCKGACGGRPVDAREARACKRARE